MELATAIHLIEKGITSTGKQTWADLGAGSGLFTNALSTLLPKGSTILAIDKKPSKITVAEGIQLQTKTGDFLKMDLGSVDGVLMANSLHYVKDQKDLLDRLSAKVVLIVEYDTNKGNPWVPYPISFQKLESMTKAKLLARVPSQYNAEGMYSALISF